MATHSAWFPAVVGVVAGGLGVGVAAAPVADPAPAGVSGAPPHLQSELRDSTFAPPAAPDAAARYLAEELKFQ